MAEVDPNRYLAKAASTTYVHTEENVYYFEKAGNGKGWGTWGTKSRYSSSH